MGLPQDPGDEAEERAMADTCDACGERNARDAGFCAACGEYLGWDQRPQADAQPAGTRQDGTQPAGTRQDGTRQDDVARDDAEQVRQQDVARQVEVVAPTVPPQATPVDDGASQQDPAPPSASTTTSSPVHPAPSPDRTCPDCGTVSAAERRFCRRCGYRVAPVEDGGRSPGPAARAGAPTWWQRLGGHRAPGATREARRAYRRSVPLRYRSARAAAFVLPVLLVVALLAVAGRDPVGSARGLWYDLRGTTELVDGVEATADPAEGGVAGWPPELAVDGSAENAWATEWTPVPSDGSPAEPCADGTQSPAAQALVLEWPEPVELRSVMVLGGLPDTAAEAASVRGPQLLELRFDSSCQALEVPVVGTERTVALDPPVRADRVRIAVMTASEVDVALEPDRVAISSIRLRARPE